MVRRIDHHTDLVIFVIRTIRPCWNGRQHPALIATSLGALAVALILALTPLSGVVGFVFLPAPMMAAIAAVTVLYLACAEVLKRFVILPPRRLAAA